MKLALLISGNIRTFVFNEQICFFKKLIDTLPKNTDYYILLKIDDPRGIKYFQSEQGIINLKKQIEQLKPVYCCIYNKNKNYNYSWFYPQVFQINFLLETAKKYSLLKNFNYDYYIRFRPDYFFKNFINDFSELDKNFIYTNQKFDSIGCDQLIIIIFAMRNEYNV